MASHAAGGTFCWASTMCWAEALASHFLSWRPFFTEAETETCLRGKVLNAWPLLPTPAVMEVRVSPLSSRSSELMQQPPLPSFGAPMYSQLPLLSFSGGPQGPGHRGGCLGVKLGWGKEEEERE